MATPMSCTYQPTGNHMAVVSIMPGKENRQHLIVLK